MPEKKILLTKLIDKASSTGGISYFTSAVAGLILMLVAAFTGYKITRLKREAAVLKSKLSKAREEQVRAKEDAQMTTNDTYRMVAQANLGHWNKKIQELRTKSRNVSVKTTRAKGTIDSISSWGDITISDKRDQNADNTSDPEPDSDPSRD